MLLRYSPTIRDGHKTNRIYITLGELPIFSLCLNKNDRRTYIPIHQQKGMDVFLIKLKALRPLCPNGRVHRGDGFDF